MMAIAHLNRLWWKLVQFNWAVINKIEIHRCDESVCPPIRSATFSCLSAGRKFQFHSEPALSTLIYHLIYRIAIAYLILDYRFLNYYYISIAISIRLSACSGWLLQASERAAACCLLVPPCFCTSSPCLFCLGDCEHCSMYYNGKLDTSS
jgi:hypothetical protein